MRLFFMELEEGDILEGSAERWEVQRFLGQGKCCSVYEATTHQHGSESRAAVKVYKKEEKYASAGINEAQLLQMLHKDGDGHENGSLFIVGILDVFNCEGHLCILNPSLACSLHGLYATHCYHGNGLPVYVVQKCCTDLTCGLKYLKAKGVIHADIKPTNIMWNSQSEVFQFVDFGLSFIEGKQPSQQIQSPGYQGPEAQQWNQSISTAVKKVDWCSCVCDIWSMACVLFLMYSGQHLFQPEEKIPLVCNSCLQASTCMCSYGLKVQETLPLDWITLKDVTKEQHESLVDLLIKMLVCKPEQRITPDVIGSHPFLNSKNTIRNPSISDLLILPTRVLQLTNMFDKLEELNDSDEYKEFIDDIRQECEGFGEVKSVCIPFLKDTNKATVMGKVFVEFADARNCEVAYHRLTGRTFNERTVIASYFPIEQLQSGEFY